MSAATAPSKGAPSLHIHDARLSYAGLTVFDGLSLDVAAGRTTCLLGASGVGKSSLLRLIAGLGPSAENGGRGTAEAAETLTAAVTAGDGAPLAGRLAWMGQTDLLLPWLSARDNAALGFRLRGEAAPLAAARGRATALLRAFGLGTRLDSPPDALSGGMRQRVALARTLVEDRPVVLMDEPFGQLDALTRLRLQDLAASHLAGRTVLLVTHDPLEAARLGDEILMMAGAPATVERVAIPADAAPTPRAADADATLALQAALLRRLAARHPLGEAA
ncbi:MAG: ABC transporter ATP-binding protein [Rhodospirillales bacterium]|nr:MAG: ABC transporter ATP-binding protein [Rhodospirillales bacterium]